MKEAPPLAMRDVDGAWSGLAVELWRRVGDLAELPRYDYEASGLEALLDAVAAGDADVGLGALSVTAERETRLDFSHPFLATGLGVAMRPDRGGESLWGRLRLLWSRGFGRLLGGLLIGLVALGLLITWTERRRNPAFRDARGTEAVRLGFWWAFVMALGHKGIFPKTFVGRVLAGTLMLASLLLLSVFVGAIASVLTVSQLHQDVEGTDDLRRLRIASVVETTSASFLARARVGHANHDSVDSALDALIAGDVDAVVYDRPLLLHAARTRLQNRIAVLPIVFEPQDYAFALAPDHPYREAINRAILEIRGTNWWRDQKFLHLGE